MKNRSLHHPVVKRAAMAKQAKGLSSLTNTACLLYLSLRPTRMILWYVAMESLESCKYDI